MRAEIAVVSDSAGVQGEPDAGGGDAEASTARPRAENPVAAAAAAEAVGVAGVAAGRDAGPPVMASAYDNLAVLGGLGPMARGGDRPPGQESSGSLRNSRRARIGPARLGQPDRGFRRPCLEAS